MRINIYNNIKNKILLYIYMYIFHYCDMCNIQLENIDDFVCQTCFDILMEECFPSQPEEPEQKKRKRT